jgi:hypothetical protein
MKKLITLSLSLLALGACTSRKHCNAIDAELIGAKDGRAYDAAQSGLQRGAVCTEEYSVSSFRKDYENGYTKALKESCSVDGASNLALLDVARGNTERANLTKIGACRSVGANLKTLEAAYVKTYISGMCTDDKVKAIAAEHGAKFADASYVYVEGVCATAPNRSALTQSYKKAYNDALKTACDFGSLKLLAQNDARKKVDQAVRLNDLGKCPGDQWRIKDLYSTTFDTEVLKIKVEEEQRLRQEAEKRANERSNVVGRCEIIAVNEVEVSMNNLNAHTLKFEKGMWNVRLLNNKGKLVAVATNPTKLVLGAGETKTFKQKFKAGDVSKANQCDARYVD